MFRTPYLKDLAAVVDKAEPVANPEHMKTEFSVAPLHPAQSQLVKQARALPNDPTLSLSALVPLPNDWETGEITERLQALCVRHDALRLTINGDTQEVLDAIDLPFEVCDYSDVPHDAVIETLFRDVLRASLTPISIQATPLWRAVLVRRPDRCQALFFTMHHTIGDGTSLSLLIQDLLKGEGSTTGNLLSKLQVAKPPSEQIDRLVAPFLAPDAQLSMGLPDSAEDASRLAQVQSHRLPAEVTRAIDEAARIQGTTLYAVAATALLKMLRPKAASDKLRLATNLDGRAAHGAEGMVGPFARFALLPIAVERNALARDVLSKVEDALGQALDCVAIPFELALQRLAQNGVELDALAPISLILTESATIVSVAEAENAVWRPLQQALQSIRPDGVMSHRMVVSLSRSDQGLDLVVISRKSIFSETEAGEFADAFEESLASVARQLGKGVTTSG